MQIKDRLFYNKLKQKNYQPKNICEIGVYKPEFSNILGFIYDNIPATLIEADPECIQKIKDLFINYNNVKIVEAAVFDFNGTVELCKSDSSTFISELKSSPALVNDNYEKTKQNTFIAKSILFSDIDKGDFDLISIDIEGAEWYVLKNMISRPNVISIETHGKYYTNPNIDNIKKWMFDNKYKLWYKDNSDSVYIKEITFDVSFIDKIKLFFKDLQIKLIKQKKLLKKLISKF